MPPGPPHRTERGAILPSPVVMLTIVAVVMAAVALVVTRDDGPSERDVTPAAQRPSPSVTEQAEQPEKQPRKKRKPAVKRGEVYVEIYNNSNIGGLAGRVSERAGGIGWNVVGSDNWVGTIPANTVYFPERLTREAKQLALDLGIERTYPAVAPMKLDRLTVILVQELA